MAKYMTSTPMDFGDLIQMVARPNGWGSKYHDQASFKFDEVLSQQDLFKFMITVLPGLD
jgi:hypothetical protein